MSQAALYAFKDSLSYRFLVKDNIVVFKILILNYFWILTDRYGWDRLCTANATRQREENSD